MLVIPYESPSLSYLLDLPVGCCLDCCSWVVLVDFGEKLMISQLGFYPLNILIFSKKFAHLYHRIIFLLFRLTAQWARFTSHWTPRPGSRPRPTTIPGNGPSRWRRRFLTAAASSSSGPLQSTPASPSTRTCPTTKPSSAPCISKRWWAFAAIGPSFRSGKRADRKRSLGQRRDSDDQISEKLTLTWKRP